MPRNHIIVNNRPYPGVWIHEELLKPLNISPNDLAEKIGVQPIEIIKLINGEHPITVDLVMRLEKQFNLDHQFWLNLQESYDHMENIVKHSKEL